MEKEQKLDFRTDFYELKITGVLDYEKYKTLAKHELGAFIKRDTESAARKFVSVEWEKEVNVKAEYIVIDSYYKVHEKVTAQLVYNHANGAYVEAVLTTDNKVLNLKPIEL